jgi:hypothetical protein
MPNPPQARVPAPANAGDRTPAVKSAKCPTCGRQAAVLFYPVHDNGPSADARLACLECCPKPGGEVRP